MPIREQLIERFFRYLAVTSQSDIKVTTLPSTPGQQRLAELLADELRALGLDDVAIDDRATVTAVKRGTVTGAPKIGFIAHLDTFDAGLSPDIRPQLLRFDGADLCLNRDRDIWLRVAEHPQLRDWVGAEIIASDGTSVLGADNKAAIAVIMTLLANLGPQDRHGDIAIAFVPDEEIGLRGAKVLDLARFPCDFAYTIDSCELGEVVIENFNAAAVEITLTGVSTHPMSAKGVLVNPVLMAQDFISRFDRTQTPEHTEGREGYVWFNAITANASEARLGALIRDFDRTSFEARKRRIEEVTAEIAALYPTGRVECVVRATPMATSMTAWAATSARWSCCSARWKRCRSGRSRSRCVAAPTARRSRRGACRRRTSSPAPIISTRATSSCPCRPSRSPTRSRA
jgi:tripeptide aminopeptidase